MNEILNLKPERVWYYFNEILKIPRPSKKEGKIIEYLLNFGKEHKLETLKDEVGNVVIRKAATKGMENKRGVCLQTHTDMVCEKNSDKIHNFEKDVIEPWIDNGWVKAKGTTLGADDGIGVAVQLAILDANDVVHGPLECLFTVDEETGLTGAFALKTDFLKSRILINLDSEDEGQLFIGCAGGKDTVITFKFVKQEVEEGFLPFRITVKGLKGGHSGDDINKGLGNANKILNRILWTAAGKYHIRLAMIDGGNLRNAIAREANADIIVPKEYAQELKEYIPIFNSTLRNEYKISEPDLNVSIGDISKPAYVIDRQTQANLLNTLYACPHGVIAMSQEIKGFVQTSTNLASIKMNTNENTLNIATSQRSSIESEKDDIANMVESVFRLIGAKVEHSTGYPGWKPNTESEILEITKASYKKLFVTDPKVLVIHAGLECGLIGEKYPGMDMISYGPTLRGVHSPYERLEIETVEKFWKLTLEVLRSI
jgi:dipeptidase D